MAIRIEPSDVDLDERLRRLEALPDRLDAVLSATTDHRRAERPPSGEWSLVEHLCHLRDLEREGLQFRMRAILETDSPTLPDIDGGRLATERDYRHQDAARAFEELSQARAASIALVRTLTSAQLGRRGSVGTFGVVTIGDLLQIAAEHDADHLGQIDALVSGLAKASP